MKPYLSKISKVDLRDIWKSEAADFTPWLAQEGLNNKACLRVYWYEGHIMFAVPRKQYAKIALDTDRGKMAYDLCRDYGFEFDDQNQKSMYNIYEDCFGNDVWVRKDRKNCRVWIGFDQRHKLKIQIECKSKDYAKELLEIFEDSSYIDDDENWIQLPDLYHSTKVRSYSQLCQVIHNIFEVIPGI